MDLPAHATVKSFRIFAGASAAALLALLIPLYVTGGALPRSIEKTAAPAEISVAPAAESPAVVEPEARPVFEAVYTVDVFDPERDAEADLAMTVERAAAENKRILLEVGGDWCVWTRSMDVFLAENEAVATALGRDFLIMKVNYSQVNDNYEFLRKFIEVSTLPHYLILDPSGNLVHSQETGVFEKGNSYDEASLVAFFTEWATRDPDVPGDAGPRTEEPSSPDPAP